MITRHRFDILTDTGGDFVDTGPPMSGFVLQMSLDTGAFDTGCDFKLEAIGTGVVIADFDNVGGSTWAKAPRILTFDTGGTEVADTFPVLAGDSLRLTVTQSAGVTGSKAGTLYVWTGE